MEGKEMLQTFAIGILVGILSTFLVYEYINTIEVEKEAAEYAEYRANLDMYDFTTYNIWNSSGENLGSIKVRLKKGSNLNFQLDEDVRIIHSESS